MKAFVDRVNEIIRAAHADGTLKALSKSGSGRTTRPQAGEFDLDELGQEVK